MEIGIEAGLRPASSLVRSEAVDRFCPLAAVSEAGLQDVTSPDGAHMGLVAACGARSRFSRPLVLVQEAGAVRDFGAAHARGLARWGIDPSRLIRVRVGRPRDALWAMEEAVKAGLDVLGEIEGGPRVLDFTATRRLSLFARGSGVRCVLARLGRRAEAVGSSGAGWRWRIAPAPSAPDPHDAKAPGAPRWELELLRARTRPPGRWLIEAARSDEHAEPIAGAPHRLRVVPELAAGDLAAGRGEEGGVIIPFRPRRAA